MNPTELRELARTFVGIADGKPWQSRLAPYVEWTDESQASSVKSCLFYGAQIRLKPWELTDTVNGHTLPPGAEWHRQDFPESMLPPPYRPLMKGEVPIVGDQYCSSLSSWLPIGDKMQAQPAEFWPELWHRTTRPIPAPEPQWVPLGPEDVSPFTRFRVKILTEENRNTYWIAPVAVTSNGIVVCVAKSPVTAIGWFSLKEDYEQNNSLAAGKWNPTLWEPCRKQSNS